MISKQIPNSDLLETINAEILSNTFSRFVVFSDVINRFVNIIFKDSINWLKIESLIQLVVIGKGQMTHGEMANNLLRSKQHITKLVNDLEEEGLIQRSLDKNNRRIAYVHITNEGVNYIKRSLAEIGPINKSLRTKMNDSEFEIIADLIRRIRRELIEYINDTIG